jgi:3-dehydroquinate synthase
VAVVIDPDALATLPEREYRAGLFEVIKYGVISSPELFDLLATARDAVLARSPDIVERMIAESVRIKAEVVSADEKEGDLRRVLNFGHTIGHALEAHTRYERFLHGEAVAFGMNAAAHLATITGVLSDRDCASIVDLVAKYGPIPPLDGVTADDLIARLGKDKKTIQGKVHFVLPDRIGHVVIRSGVSEENVRRAIQAALA